MHVTAGKNCRSFGNERILINVTQKIEGPTASTMIVMGSLLYGFVVTKN